MKIHEDIENTLPKQDYIEYDLGPWGKARIQRWPLMDSPNLGDYTPVIIRWEDIFENSPSFTLQTDYNGTT
jgi:hypothetical protein